MCIYLRNANKRIIVMSKIMLGNNNNKTAYNSGDPFLNYFV